MSGRPRLAGSAISAVLASCAGLGLTGCSVAESGMMAITVDSEGGPVGVAVACHDELRVGHLQRWVAQPQSPARVSPDVSSSTTDGAQEIASWALPAATREIVAWSLAGSETVDGVRPLSAPPELGENDAYRLVGTSASGQAQRVQFTLTELRHVQPGQAIVLDRGGESRIVDLNSLVDIACTDSGLAATRSPDPNGVSAQDG